MQTKSINKKSWLKEGLLLQISKDKYFLGEGPFERTSKATKGIYCPDFFLKEKKPWIVPKKYTFVNRKELEDLLDIEKLESSNLSTDFKIAQPVSFLDLQTNYFKIQNKIKSGEIQKMLIFTCEKLKGQVHVLDCLKKSFKKSQKFSSYLYGIWNNQKGLMGLTPEILFSVKESQFFTMALAGTSQYPGPCLFYNSKEVKEHAYVIQDIEESLKGLVSWTSENTYEKPSHNIKHLCTEKFGKLKKPFCFSEYINKLHPTAALGSYPKKDFKKHLKNQDRSFFGSPIAYFDGKDQAFCLVAIRNIEWEQDMIRVASGAGIVQESDLQKEWQELNQKREQIKRIFF